MGTTPKFSIPYVEPADLVANYPTQDKAQADRLEAVLTGTVDDTGWLDGATIITANATNFTLVMSKVRKVGSRVNIFMQGTMKVVSNFPPAGDIGNLNLATVAAPYIPTTPGTIDQGITPGGAGRLCMYYITPVGGIYVGAVAGTIALAVGETVSMSGSYLL